MMRNLTEFGEARGNLLSIRLDNVSSGQVSQAVVNKEGYMTELDSMKVNSVTEINDIYRAKKVAKSMITHNSNSSSGWIGYARILEIDGKIEEARNTLAQACLKFPSNEDIWLEAARLSPPERTKILLAKAVSQMPYSKKLWIQASRKEAD